jgi:uncharacterized membrane protein (DUF485 family)
MRPTVRSTIWESSCFSSLIAYFIHPGLGAFAAPLVATQFAQMERWSFHYFVALGLAVLNTLSMILVFRFKSREGGP